MNFFRKHDLILTIVTWVLVALSIVTIYSITYSAESAIYGAGTANKQFLFALIGIAIYGFISFFVDYSYLKNKTVLTVLYIVIVGLLIVVLGISQANRGSVRWIPLGFFNLEPSELGKLLVIIAAAAFYEKNLKGEASVKSMILKTLLILPLIGLVFVQPNLSMALSLIFITGFVFVSSVPDPGKLAVGFLTLLISFFITILSIGDYSFFNLLRLSSAISFLQNERILLIVISGILLFTTIFFFRKNCLIIILIFTLLGSACGFGYSFAWNNVLKDYQKDRINTFINPEEDPLGDGYQVNQSIIATGSGQIWGRGFGRGTQSNLNFLPERHTDFIFASYAEEFGFVGSILLVGLYVILLSRIISIGIRSQDGFGFLVCIGVAAMILFQFLVNVGMNIGIMPVTGVTLPLFSYGGSSLITTLMAIALVQSVSKGQDLINMKDSLILRERV